VKHKTLLSGDLIIESLKTPNLIKEVEKIENYAVELGPWSGN
jgi:hypothetical protein